MGWDPIRFARLEGVERLFADEVLDQAVELHCKEIEYLGNTRLT